MSRSPVRALFVDIGGVLLTNGWDRAMRRRAAETFGLDYEEMNERHHLTFDTYEEGKLSLEEYLHRVVFYEPRTFDAGRFRSFMFDQSKPLPGMLELLRETKKRHRLKVLAVSNEGRELAAFRAGQFHLGEVIDAFVISCFVHYRKPDPDIYRIALDIAQVSPSEVLYLEDRAMFVEVAGALGIRGYRHTGLEETRAWLAEMGLPLTG